MIDWNQVITSEQKAVEAQVSALRAALSNNNSAYEAATIALTADYPQLEKDTWATQDKESRAWVEDQSAHTPWIDRAAAERGIDREDYLRRTIIKAEQFKLLSAFLTGRRQRYEDQIKAGGSPELDYHLTADVLQAMHAITLAVAGTPAGQLLEVLS